MMKNILHIISSPRGEASFSIKLGNAIIEKIENSNPDSLVRTTNLSDRILPHLSASHLASFFTPEDQHTSDNKETVRASEESVADLKWADIIVVGVPVYNFGIPSALKAWVDHIARAGKTFSYSASGAEGLLKDKKVYIALASGAVFSEGPMQDFDFASPYLKSVLGFLGLTDVETYRVEGTAIPDLAENALEKGISSIAV